MCFLGISAGANMQPRVRAPVHPGRHAFACTLCILPSASRGGEMTEECHWKNTPCSCLTNKTFSGSFIEFPVRCSELVHEIKHSLRLVLELLRVLVLVFHMAREALPLSMICTVAVLWQRAPQFHLEEANRLLICLDKAYEPCLPHVLNRLLCIGKLGVVERPSACEALALHADGAVALERNLDSVPESAAPVKGWPVFDV
mmetsp:Transcript_92434/g.214799  ORF Transcript_92434/g.214799 Transcript_92434/m.214799 type:complete len:201 (-) Transcript_92434:719-1321(-)